MATNPSKYLTVLCLFITAVNSAKWTRSEPWVTPTTYIDDGRPFIEFTCTAYLKNDDVLLWGLKGQIAGIAGIHQFKYRSGFRTLNLIWPVDKGLKIFCTKRNVTFITKDFIWTDSPAIPINFQRSTLPLNTTKPQITPEVFKDNGRRSLEFTCWAFLKEGELLTWFQVKDSNTTLRLAMTIHETWLDTYEKVVLRKTLEPSDKNTEVYCAKEKASEDQLLMVEETKRIKIKFDRHIEPLKKPHAIVVKPNSDVVMFDECEELEFVCGGSAPIDGRSLTWHLLGQYTYPPKQQSYNRSLNLNRLVLRMDVLHDGNQLYCAQDFQLKVSPPYGDAIARSYGELTRSRIITLKHQKQEKPGVTSWSLNEPWITQVTSVQDGKPFLEFTCKAHLQIHQGLMWHQRKDGEKESKVINEIFPYRYNIGYMTFNLLVPLEDSANGSTIFCLKGFYSHTGNSTSLVKQNSSEIVSIQFKKEDVRSGDVTITISNIKKLIPQITLPESRKDPTITPATFVDDGQSVAEFVCWAFLEQWEVLTWFQIKGSSNAERLAMVQQETKHGYIKIQLLKCLQLSDNGTQIYCAKEEHLEGDRFKVVSESKRIPLLFDRSIQPWEMPYVTIEGSTEIMLFDENDMVELVCSGSDPIDGRGLTWYLQGQFPLQNLPFAQRYDKTNNQNNIILQMEAYYHEYKLYCAQDFNLKVSSIYGNLITASYGELAKSKMITLLNREEKAINMEDKPLVTPKKFTDEGRLFILFNCYAFLEKGHLLSWHQTKESRSSEDTLLRMIQLQDLKYKAGQWTQLTLNKSLEPSDNGSEIYCAKRSLLPNGSFSNGIESQRIPLIIQTKLPPLEVPFITIEPSSSNFYFEINDKLHFSCTGSTPIDGRTYTWFRTDPEATITVPDHQAYDVSTNVNILELSLNESYHLNQLFCAQAFLAHIARAAGAVRSEAYGELARSKTITLILPEKAIPQIIPENVVFEDKLFLVLTCRAFLQTGQLLSWFQSKVPDQLEDALLRTTQLQNSGTAEGQWIELTLRKTLQPGDNGSEVYCAKQRVLLNGSLEDGLESRRVSLVFQTDVPPLTSFVKVEPGLVVYFVVGTKRHFSCSGSIPVDGRSYTWLQTDSNSNVTVPEEQKYDTSTNVNTLELSFNETYDRSQLFCAQGFLARVRLADGSNRNHFYGEVVRSDIITLIQLMEDDKPQILPDIYVDKGESSVRFTCFAFLQPGQLLSWYQGQGSNGILLRTNQLDNAGSEEGQWMELVLEKTLEPADNGSEVYCAKQRASLNGTLAGGVESKRATLAFNTDVPPLRVAFITTEPSTADVYFNVSERLRFTCTGSIPADGRSYTWLRKDMKSSETVPKTQAYDATMNVNVLELYVSELYHESQLFCVQGFVVQIRLADGSFRYRIYGELTRSNVINLILPEINKPQVTPKQVIDKNTSIIEFSCRAFLQMDQLLSWYQRGPTSSEDKLLKVIQLQQPANEKGQWVVLSLKRTLESSDNGSEIYCTKQTLLLDGSLANGLESERVPLTFHTVIPPPERFVSIQPSTDVFYVSGGSRRFVCSGSVPVDDRAYTWLWIGSGSSNVYIPDEQNYKTSTNVTVLELPLNETYDRTQLFCAQGFVSRVRLADGSVRNNFYGELARSDKITLIQLVKDGKPQITPDDFKDKNNSIIQFTCYAFLQTGELLSWYQLKGSDKSNDTLLRMIQLEDHGTKTGRWMELALNKTLEPSDNGSVVYCAKQSVLSDGTLSEGLESQRVPITVHRKILPLEPPYVITEPNTTIYSDVYSTEPSLRTFLRFTCSGSAPVDGRIYHWFIIDSNSNLEVPDDQKYEPVLNTNVLHLSPINAYNRSQLYCAQGFISHIRRENGSLRPQFYAELVRSNMISLILREKAEKPAMVPPDCPLNKDDQSMTSLTLPLVLGLAQALLAAVLTALVAFVVITRHATPATLAITVTPAANTPL